MVAELREEEDCSDQDHTLAHRLTELGLEKDMVAELREEEGCSDQDHTLAHRAWIRERHDYRAEGRGRLF
ncbi:hypothetical protein RRG08_005783 [Elysia crispata]|uniref:Uncharacterized protein n=1 Tax=Elysia crispata TaxID=231223 RepID=A0AAE0XMZ0_9GAST|nr:hypothetical protein RRG08_005783 [Elysia crispata]